MFSAFMLNAWAAGLIVAVTAGVVGFFVVLRGASFAAHALPLGTFPGAAAAVLLGIAPSAGVAGFGLAGVVAIWALG
ncbi:metal ABC transporter permease, partial [Acidiphilium sp.]